MLRSRSLDVDQLHQALKAARRRGARAARLVKHAPGVIELLYPAGRYPDLTVHDRAAASENLIAAAVDSLGEDGTRPLSVLLCLAPGTLNLNLRRRREMVAKQAGVLPGTWERGWREPQLFDDLTAVIYRLHQTSDNAYIPAAAEDA
jgi:hypothetical protein